MLKSTVLFVSLVTACAQEPGTGSRTSAGTVACDAAVDAPTPALCTVNGQVIDLNTLPANTNHSDRRVTFCHATSSPTNPYVLITTSVNACDAHEMHVHLEQGGHLDIFPFGRCAD